MQSRQFKGKYRKDMSDCSSKLLLYIYGDECLFGSRILCFLTLVSFGGGSHLCVGGYAVDTLV